MTEDQIQAQIFKWYHNNYCAKNSNIIFSVPNGGTRNKAEAMKFKATGLVAGVSDLIIVTEKEVLFVEVKTAIGRQSEVQKKFEKKVTNLGYRYLVVRSLEDFKNNIK